MTRSLLIPAALCVGVLGALAPAQAIPLATVLGEMNAAASSNPSICQLVDLNATYGSSLTHLGQSIKALKISDNVGQDEDEPACLIVSAHHGNEYGTTHVALYAIGQLLGGYGVDPQITALVDNNEIWIIPVWNVDGYPNQRHNRRPGGGVDLNRNYPFLWSTCNSGVRGPAPGSEPETQTMMAFAAAERFTKVHDYHSSGREALYGYYQSGSCPVYVLQNYVRTEAIALSQAESYGGAVRGPSSNGEHYQWQLGTYSNFAFLTEISNTQSPSTASANMEAQRLWPGTVWMLERPIPVSGHVRDANTGLPVEASITYLENPFTQSEQNHSEPKYGRYHAFLPNGSHTLRFSHPCYEVLDVAVSVTSAGTVLDVELEPVCADCAERNGSGVNLTGYQCLTLPVLGTNWDLSVPTTGSTLSTLVAFSLAPAQIPFFSKEILIDLTFSIFVPGTGLYSIGIPNDITLTGAPLYTQGFRVDDVASVATLILLNALDATIGL
jgi:hypothetical protein